MGWKIKIPSFCSLGTGIGEFCVSEFNLRYIIFWEFPESILALAFGVRGIRAVSICTDIVKIFSCFLEFVLVHHLQFFDEPATVTTFPV